MNDRVKVYDGLINDELCEAMYEWATSVPYYAGFALSDDDMPKFDFIPGKDNHKIPAYVRRALYRHPVGSTKAEVERRNIKPVMDLWEQINEKIFGGRADYTKGIYEAHPGMQGPSAMHSDPEGSFCDKYGYGAFRAKKGWTVYLNARSATVNGQSVSVNKPGVDGNIHKDTSNDKDTTHYDKTGYFTVLFVVNRKWNPSWRGDIIYFGEEDSGETHWKRGWNMGYANMIVGNKPGRIIIAESEATHTALTPSLTSDEMSLRMAFRVKVTPDENGNYVQL
jgi:hypothetical protein